MTKPLLHLRNRVSGLYTFTKGKVDAQGAPIPGTEQQVARFGNLITDNGMDSIEDCPGGSFGTKYLFPRCFVGTGSTAPAFTDSTLDVFLAANDASVESGTTTFVDSVTEPYWKHVKVYRFSAGVATGNLTEVGTGWGTTGTDLFSRALILDGGGSPTTITVLSDEYLDVTFEYRNYIDIVDFSGTITISSVPYDIPTARACDIDAAPNLHLAINDGNSLPRLTLYQTNTLGTVYTSPIGSNDADTSSTGAYTPGSFYVDITFSYALGDANFSGGIGAGVFQTNQCRFQFSFSPKIPKTSSMIMSLVLRVSWARYP